MDDWKKDYMQGVRLIWPNDSLRESVNTLRAKYDSESQKICDAHITLTQPFLNQPDDAAWKHIQSILTKYSPFDIEYGPIEIFGNSPVLKFDINPKEKILKLRNGLHETGLFNLSLPFTEGFIPHMTISENGFKDITEAQKTADELNSEINTGNFTCTHIAYVQPDSNFHFEERKLLPLTKNLERVT